MKAATANPLPNLAENPGKCSVRDVSRRFDVLSGGGLRDRR
jgi:hypothetical protein